MNSANVIYTWGLGNLHDRLKGDAHIGGTKHVETDSHLADCAKFRQMFFSEVADVAFRVKITLVLLIFFFFFFNQRMIKFLLLGSSIQTG